MPILVLPTASVAATSRFVSRSRAEGSDALMVVVGPREARPAYTEGDPSTRFIQAPPSPLSAAALSRATADIDVDEVVLPMSVPPPPMLFAVWYVLKHSNLRATLVWGERVQIRGRVLVVVAALVHWLVFRVPWVVLVYPFRAIDKGLLLAAILLARARGTRSGGGRGEPPGPIVHVITHLGHGGAQRQLIEYLRSSRSRETVVVIALFESDSDVVAALRGLECRVELLIHDLRKSRWSKLMRVLFPMSLPLVILMRRFQALQPRLSFHWLLHANVIGSCAARLTGVPKVCSSVRVLSSSYWRLALGRSTWQRLLDRLTAPLNDVIVGNSRAVVADYREWAQVDSSSVMVVHNGIDANRFREHPLFDPRMELRIPPAIPVLLSVGRLSREKNFPLLIRCSARLLERGTRHNLVIVGGGEQEVDLRHHVESLGLRDTIHLVGSTVDVESYYRAADVFILSSLSEGLPNVVLEAMLLELPVVTTNFPGADELVLPGETGFIVPLDDIDAMSDAIERLIASPETRRRFGARGASLVRRDFTLEKMARSIDRITGRGSTPMS